MNKRLILPLLLISSIVFADDLSQRYEKAYFLETAKGQTEEALKIYRQIAATEVTDENHTAVIKTLQRLLRIYSTRNLQEDTKQDRLKKAIALQAIGHNRQAIAILQELSDPDLVARTSNTIVHSKALIHLLEIAIQEDHQKRIAQIQERMLKETDETLHSLILKMPNGGTVYLPEGVYTGDKLAYHSGRNIWINKEITIKGTNRNKCIIEGVLDRPMIHAEGGSKITLESLTLKSQILSYNKKSSSLEQLGCALKIDNNASVTLTNCNIIAGGNILRSPLAIHAEGFSKADLIDCRISGFAIPLFYGEGSVGSIRQSMIQSELRTSPNSFIEVSNTIFHDAEYDAINCDGGTLSMESCLILNSAGALSISTATDKFSMSNSAVMNCGKILTPFRYRVSREGTVALKNNIFISNSLTAGNVANSLIVESRIGLPSKRILLNNIFYGNTAENWSATLLADETDDGLNAFWNNEGLTQAVTNQSLAVGKMLLEDPQLNAPENGDFTPKNPNVIQANHGLADPPAIKALWKKYKETCK